jgi:hypothetical protein
MAIHTSEERCQVMGTRSSVSKVIVLLPKLTWIPTSNQGNHSTTNNKGKECTLIIDFVGGHYRGQQ